MPSPDERPPLTRGTVLRGLVFTVAVLLAAAGVWLIVVGSGRRDMELGILAGLWGLFIGWWSVGSRRGGSAQPQAVEHAAVELRRNAELERAQEVAARRAHEQRLEQLLRHELQSAMAGEVAQLRAEIAQLRGDLLEKVGGQLRLERIETTRLIGSDLEALQHEVRSLKSAARETDVGDGLAEGLERLRRDGQPVVAPARVRPISRETAQARADVQAQRVDATQRVDVPQRPVPPEPQTTAAQAAQAPHAPETHAPAAPVPTAPAPTAPAPTAPVPAASQPAAPAPELPEPADATARIRPVVEQPSPMLAPPEVTHRDAAAADPAAAAPEPARPGSDPGAGAATASAAAGPGTSDGLGDGFASLPRIRPFTDFALDPVDTTPPYAGRRRRSDHAAPEAPRGRHSQSADGDDDGRGGRRRAQGHAAESDDSVLRRLLDRETTGQRRG